MKEKPLPYAFTEAFQSSLIVALEWDLHDGSFFSSDAFDEFMISTLETRDLHDLEALRPMVHPEDYRAICEAIQRFKGTHQKQSVVKRLLMKNGQWHWTRITISYISREGTPVRAIATLLDIHDYVHEKMRLDQTENWLATIIETIPAGIVIGEDCGSEINVEYISDQALRIFGYSREVYDLLKGKNGGIEPIGDLNTILRLTARQLADGPSWSVRTRVMRLDGTRIDLDVKGVRGKESVPRCYVIFQDETKEAEEERQVRWQEERYRLLSEISGVVTFDYDPDKDVYVNSVNTDLQGRHDITIPNFSAVIEKGGFVHPQDLPRYQQVFQREGHGRGGQMKCRVDFDGLGYQWYRIRWIGIADQDGVVYRIVGRADNVEKEQKSLTAMRMQEELLQRLLKQNVIFALKFDQHDGQRIFAADDVLPENYPPVKDLSGLMAALEARLHPADQVLVWREIHKTMWSREQGKTDTQTFQCRLRLPGAEDPGYSLLRFTFFYTRAAEAADPVLLVYGIEEQEDETDRKRERDGRIDALTGILNESAFRTRCGQALQEARNGRDNDKPVAMVRIYLEEINTINRTYGHAFGDEVICRVSKTIKAMLRGGDECGRLYGCDFAVFIADASDAKLVYERTRIVQGALVQHMDNGELVTASIGLAIAQPEGAGYLRLLEQAESALYQARELGGSRIVIDAEDAGEGEEMGLMPSLLEGMAIQPRRQIFIRTFGYFEIFLNGRPLAFGSAKAKELLALLVDRRGGFVASGDAIAALWENSAADATTLSRYRKVAMRLKNTLEDYGILHILEIKKGLRRIIPERIDCDLYDYLSGQTEFARTYKGSYMLNYSWSEVTQSELHQNIK